MGAGAGVGGGAGAGAGAGVGVACDVRTWPSNTRVESSQVEEVDTCAELIRVGIRVGVRVGVESSQVEAEDTSG